MSLYRYVDSKDELYAVMLDVAYGPPDMSVTARGGWRGRLERWARAIAAVRLAHPWTVLIPLTEPPATPNATAWTECGLQAFAGTKLTAQQQLSSMLLVDGYVQHHIRQSLQLGFISETGQPQDGGDDYPQNLAQLVDPAPLPADRGRCAGGDDGRRRGLLRDRARLRPAHDPRRRGPARRPHLLTRSPTRRPAVEVSRA